MLSQVVTRTLLVNTLIAISFGILTPYIKGLEFLDVFLLLPYSFFSLFFVAPMVVDGVFAHPLKRVSGQRLFRAAGLGWLAGLAILWMGIATVSIRFGRFLAPPLAISLCLALLSLLACVLVAAIAATEAIRAATPNAAKARLRMAFLLLLAGFFAVPRLLPAEANDWLLGFLTPEGLIRATLVLAPLVTIAGAILLARLSRRQTPALH